MFCFSKLELKSIFKVFSEKSLEIFCFSKPEFKSILKVVHFAGFRSESKQISYFFHLFWLLS